MPWPDDDREPTPDELDAYLTAPRQRAVDTQTLILDKLATERPGWAP